MARGPITCRPLMTDVEKKQRQRIRSYRTYLLKKNINPEVVDKMMERYQQGTLSSFTEVPSAPKIYVLVNTSPTTTALFGPFKYTADAQRYKSTYEKAVSINQYKVDRVKVTHPFIQMIWEIPKTDQHSNILAFPKY